MITLPKEHNELFFARGCLDLSAVCYTDPKGNLWNSIMGGDVIDEKPVSYTHLRAHET